MRFAFVFLALLLAGCLQQPPAVSLTPNETPIATPPVNVTPPATITNESVAGGSVSIEGNITVQNSTAINESANETANESVPSGPATPAGIAFANGSYLLVLDDVSVSGPSAPCGIFSVRYSNGSVIDRLLICPPNSQNWLSPEGSTYRIYVIEVAAGYTHEENWARVIIFG